MDPTKLDINMDPSLLTVTSQNTGELEEQPEKGKAKGWSEKQCLELIKEFESHSLLWDSLHEAFHKPLLKLDAWREVARRVGRSPEACKHKMRILMSGFRREKQNMVRHNASSKKRFRSKWYAFEAMSFLLTKKTKVLNKDDHLAITMPVHKYVRPALKREPPEELIPDVEIKTEIIEKTEEEIQAPCSSTSHCMDEEVKDEIRAFSDFIAAKMRSYDTKTRSIVQREIGSILFNADQCLYEDACLPD